ncbi:MAG: hypothetical protein EBS72_13815, partial [Rhizobiales bacterium]|nr:hypothetical protein [Hyphomicrobiales bacterium]
MSEASCGKARRAVARTSVRWRRGYNTLRPHRSLGYRPPAPESRRPCPLAPAPPQPADRADPLAGLPW